MRRAVTGIVGMAAALAVPLATGTATVARAAAPVAGCDSTSIAAVGDLDGDSVAEVVVGLPTYPGGGAVDVRFSGGGGQVLTTAALGLGAGGPADRFGSSVEVVELTGDRCADLVVGAPGREGDGAVFIIIGTPQGYEGAAVHTVTAPTSAGGGGFGSSLALIPRLAGWNGIPVLAIGWPDVNGWNQEKSGAITTVPVPNGVPGRSSTFGEDTYDVPGVSEAGDRFGSVVGNGGDRILIGVPDEDTGSQRDAGTAGWLTVSPIGKVSGVVISQDSTGVPGTSESGDRFGASVVAGGVLNPRSAWQMTVGAPGEAIGATARAGSAVSLRFASRSVDSAVTIHQDGTWRGRAVPGTAEAGDAFGAALAWTSSSSDTSELVVGVPGENLSATRDAGMLTTFGVGVKESGVMRNVTESSYAGGHSESGDLFGATLASGDIAVFGGALPRVSMLVVGVPGEDVKGVVDAGAVASVIENGAARFATLSTGAVRGLRYGSAIGGLGD